MVSEVHCKSTPSTPEYIAMGNYIVIVLDSALDKRPARCVTDRPTSSRDFQVASIPFKAQCMTSTYRPAAISRSPTVQPEWPVCMSVEKISARESPLVQPPRTAAHLAYRFRRRRPADRRVVRRQTLRQRQAHEEQRRSTLASLPPACPSSRLVNTACAKDATARPCAREEICQGKDGWNTTGGMSSLYVDALCRLIYSVK